MKRFKVVLILLYVVNGPVCWLYGHFGLPPRVFSPSSFSPFSSSSSPLFLSSEGLLFSSLLWCHWMSEVISDDFSCRDFKFFESTVHRGPQKPLCGGRAVLWRLVCSRGSLSSAISRRARRRLGRVQVVQQGCLQWCPISRQWVRLDLRDRFKYIEPMNHRFEIDGSPSDTSVGGPIGRFWP